VPIRYAYSSTHLQSAAVNATGGAPAASATSPCPTVLWSSTDPTARYVWIDLTAGPISYGPQTSGDGIVTEFSLPRPDRKLFLPHMPHAKKFAHDTRPESQPVHGTAHDPERPPITDPPVAPGAEPAPASAAGSGLNEVEQSVRTHELSAELAAVVRKTVRQLFLPPIDRFPVLYTRKVTVHVVVVHDSPNVPTDPVHSWAAYVLPSPQLPLPPLPLCSAVLCLAYLMKRAWFFALMLWVVA
jgi:hypothetical protein